MKISVGAADLIQPEMRSSIYLPPIIPEGARS